MAAMDPERVRLFAVAKGAPNVEAFLAQIEAANLWRFARRPLDLGWLVEFWERHGRLGSLSEMLENSLTARVRETNLDRAHVDALDQARALHAIERTGAALVFGRKTTIAIPDSELVLSNEDRPLDLAQVLPAWSPDDRKRLLTRPVFDPGTFGRARLHNDNEGVVRGYLAARWLHRLRQTNLARADLFELLFATTLSQSDAGSPHYDSVIVRSVLSSDRLVPASSGLSVRDAVRAVPGALAIHRSRLRIESIARGDQKRPIVRLRFKRGPCQSRILQKSQRRTSAKHKKWPTYPHIFAPMRYPIDGQGRCLKGTRGARDGRYVGLPRGSKVVPELGGG
jgi:hypothetical protein